jgi:serine/threonine protein kinase
MTETPVTVGRYQVTRLIAHGGMGSLYLARDPAIDRLIAIKLLKDGFDSSVRERFAREARATGRLRHPNIVTVFDVGEHEDRPFIAMEYVPGETLAQLIERRAPVRVVEKLAILEDLCDGLHYAHAEGIVHRDIKPANVILDTSGTLKILDFGIARVGESGITQAGDFVGTLNYMSPEQLAGENVDHRTDVYEDGALFRILHSELAPLERLVPGIDPEITEIIERAMAREPDDRYQDLADLREDLGAIRDRLVEFAPEARPDLDGEAETRHDPDGLALTQPYTPRPGKLPVDQPPGSRGSSSGKRRTSASSAGRRGPGSSARSSAGIAAPESGAGTAVRRNLLLPVSVIAGALILAVAVVLIALSGRFPGSDATPETAPPRPAQLPAAPAGTTDTRVVDSGTLDQKVSSIRATAHRQIRAGQRDQALSTVSAGLVLDRQDKELNGLLEELRRGAQQMATQARAAASRRGATEQSSREFRDAMVREREHETMERAGDRVQAVRSLWAAAALYERASGAAVPGTSAGAAPGPQPDAAPPPEIEKADLPSTRPERQPSAPPPAQPQESLNTLPGTVQKPVSPPVPPKLDPPSPPDPAASKAGDAAAIRETLHRYAEAYRSRNTAAVRAVMPSLSSQALSSLGRDFANYRSFNVVIGDEVIRVDGSAGTATVTGRVTRSFVTTTGVAGGNTVTQVFRLRKVDGSWIIEGLDSR